MTLPDADTAAPQPASATKSTPPVLRLQDLVAAGGDPLTAPASLRSVLAEFGLTIEMVPAGQPIPGSFWGEEEAGLIGDVVYARPDTPVHSLLHESCHAICMDDERRAALHTDAGGEYAEEDAVCYLQILLADRVPGMGRTRMFRDMDSWGYSFRLGSAQAWFEQDAEDAAAWLRQRNLARVTALLEAEQPARPG